VFWVYLLSLRLSYENASNAWDAPSGYVLQEGMEVKKAAWRKSCALLFSPTLLPFALKPAGLSHWRTADVLMLLRFNQAACLVPALTELQTKYSLSLFAANLA